MRRTKNKHSNPKENSCCMRYGYSRVNLYLMQLPTNFFLRIGWDCLGYRKKWQNKKIKIKIKVIKAN